MATLDDFLPWVRPSFPETPDELMRQAVRDSAIEFCEKTMLLERTADLSVVADNREQSLSLAEGVPYQLRYLRRSGNDLTPATRGTIHEFGEASGQPTHYYLESNGDVVLWPTPTAAETLEAHAIFRPEYDATELPDVLLHDWREAIAGGAKKRLGRDYINWRNEDAAQVGGIQFETGVSRAINQRGHGRHGHPVRVRPTFF